MKKKILAVISLAAILATSIPAPDAQAAWKVTDQGRQYTTNSEEGYATGWKKLKGSWYYFDQKGIMKTGWLLLDNNWYYLKSDGKMAVRTWIGGFYLQSDGTMARNTTINGIQIGPSGTRITTDSENSDDLYSKKKNGWYVSEETGSWYYYNEHGGMVKGWLVLPQGKYYLDLATGTMKKGFQKIDGKRYYFTPSTGILKTGWFKVKGKRYSASSFGIIRKNRWLNNNTRYVDKNGAAYTGFNMIGGNTYYFHPSTAKKVKGWQKIEDNWYYFDNSGVMVKRKWVTYPATRKKCYLQADGTMASNTWVGKYFVNSSGYKSGQTRSKGLYKENNKLYYNNNKFEKVSGWVTIDSKKYYFGTDYAAVIGLQSIDGKSYYFDKTGVMQTGLMEIDGTTHYFDDTGAMLVNGSITLGGITHNFDSSGGFVNPNTPVDASKGARIALYAQKFLGNPYSYGGVSLTNGADCSGFVQSVLAYFNIKIPRVAAEQATGYSPYGGPYNKGVRIAPNLKNLLPGDLVFYYGPISHVGLYIGSGKIIHASNYETGIIISKYNYAKPVAAMRYW